LRPSEQPHISFYVDGVKMKDTQAVKTRLRKLIVGSMLPTARGKGLSRAEIGIQKRAREIVKDMERSIAKSIRETDKRVSQLMRDFHAIKKNPEANFAVKSDELQALAALTDITDLTGRHKQLSGDRETSYIWQPLSDRTLRDKRAQNIKYAKQGDSYTYFRQSHRTKKEPQLANHGFVKNFARLLRSKMGPFVIHTNFSPPSKQGIKQGGEGVASMGFPTRAVSAKKYNGKREDDPLAKRDVIQLAVISVKFFSADVLVGKKRQGGIVATNSRMKKFDALLLSEDTNTFKKIANGDSNRRAYRPMAYPIFDFAVRSMYTKALHSMTVDRKLRDSKI
jgi:hypothetical protein